MKNFLTFFKKMTLLLICLFLISCSSQPEITHIPEQEIPEHKMSLADQNSSYYWWYARFKMNWSKDYKTLDFSNNLIIAHQIILPLIQTHQDSIKLWRFHRRAADDSTGHQFSFIFYAKPETAQKLFQLINNNPLSEQLKSEDIVEKIILDDINKPIRPRIEDVSDKSWSDTIQKSWPYYIMGASLVWLDMLNREIVHEKLDLSKPLQDQMLQYKKINEKITQQWKKQAKHAFFHHISGVFGYEPLNFQF